MPIAKPKVSIIITCYNTGRFLRAAVDSALGQDYEPIEVLVVDDGSTDDTPQILESYGDKLISIRQQNAGCAAARNTGLATASGDVLVILDADDILLPTCVRTRVELMQSLPGVGLVTGLTRYIDENGEAIPGAVDFKPAYPNGVSYIDAMHRIPGPISGWAIPKVVLQDVGSFDGSLRAVEDYDLCLRILAKYKCLCDPVVRTLYREVPGSLSRDYTHNYDHVRRVIRKNSALAPITRYSYWWNSKTMMLTSCAGVFTRVLKESGRSGPSRLITFLRKRPSALPFFCAWALRAAYNRVLYRFNRGPLRDKELALRDRPIA